MDFLGENWLEILVACTQGVICFLVSRVLPWVMQVNTKLSVLEAKVSNGLSQDIGEIKDTCRERGRVLNGLAKDVVKLQEHMG